MKLTRAIPVVFIAMAVCACRDSVPTGPSQTNETVDIGTWAGELKATACTRVSGEGKNTCGSLVGTTHPVRLSLQRAGNDARGTIRMFNIGAEGPVTGAFRGSATATVTASLSSVESNFRISVHSWDLQDIGQTITASPMTLRASFDNVSGPQVHEETYEVVRLERVPN